MADFDLKNPTPLQRMIVALDVPSVSEAEALVQRLGDDACFYKVGLQLLYSEGGFRFARALKAQGKQLFVDLKLLDIDNTVMRGVESLCALGADFLTIHAYPKAMRAAVKGRADNASGLLGVTVMTNLDADDLVEAGYTGTPEALVLKRAAQALDTGMDGIVCSPAEVSAIRANVGSDLLLVTPGVRPAGADIGDQKRVATPYEAIKAGASYLVVGRPVSQADDPNTAAKAIVKEIEAALT